MEGKKSKFLGLEETEKQHYLNNLKQRIRLGYFNSEKVTEGIVEKIASCFADEVGRFT